MKPQKPIQLFNRATKKIVEEKVFGAGGLQFAYSHPVGKIINRLLPHSLISHIYGKYKSTKYSAKAIPDFVEQYEIDMSQYESSSYSTFNDFFIRKFTSGARDFTQDPSSLPAFAEARYLAYNYDSSQGRYPVKNMSLTIKELLDSSELYSDFQKGTIIIARLAPVDYHRFHFPDDGQVIDSYHRQGKLHSVNPWAIKQIPNILSINDRQITLLDSIHFGKLAYIEVGAMMVGTIQQTFSGDTFQRGEEKGYFLFGGSTVILLAQNSQLKIADDIMQNSAQGIETRVLLGDKIASNLG